MFRFTILILALAWAIAPAAVFAHPPSSLEASFDLETHLLTVQVDHSVKDASKHFVHHIRVDLDGGKIIDQEFRSQVDLKRQEVVFLIIDAAPGSEITVTAACNISGEKSETIKVKKPKPEKKS